MGTFSIGEMNTSSFVGLAIALPMYGVSLGQFYEYFSSFPHDTLLLKYLVIITFIISSFQIYSMIDIQWWFLVASHDGDPTRAFPWQVDANIASSVTIPFMVQCFYGKRLLIISQNNRTLTALVWFLSFSQFFFGIFSGLWHVPEAAPTQLPFSGLSTFLGVVCDILITASVYFYLRAGRSGVKRTARGIQRLVVVTIHMGALTSTVAVAVAVNWVVNSGPSSVMTPVMIVPLSYVNSLLAILNARKWGNGEVYSVGTSQLPTLPTIQVSESGMATTPEAEGST